MNKQLTELAALAVTKLNSAQVTVITKSANQMMDHMYF